MLLVVGLNHRTAPIELRERLAAAPSQLPAILGHWANLPFIQESVLLSTCNRFELYLVTSTPDQARAEARAYLKEKLGDHFDQGNHIYEFSQGEAVAHLFRVASGLDSMVVGENEILAQVKQAYTAAHQAGATGKLLNVLFQRSLFVGKQVRTETGLSQGGASVASVAATLAQRIFGSLSNNPAMILGAGDMAELTARHLLSQKVESLFVANRTYERAVELAKQFGGKAMTFEEGLRYLTNVDIVICSTAAPHPVITPELVQDIMAAREGRLLFFIDIAVPRDVHPDVHHIDNVYVYNIDDLQGIVNETQEKRSGAVARAGDVVSAKATEFTRWLQAHESGEKVSLQHYAPTNPKLQIPSSK